MSIKVQGWSLMCVITCPLHVAAVAVAFDFAVLMFLCSFANLKKSGSWLAQSNKREENYSLRFMSKYINDEFFKWSLELLVNGL